MDFQDFHEFRPGGLVDLVGSLPKLRVTSRRRAGLLKEAVVVLGEGGRLQWYPGRQHNVANDPAAVRSVSDRFGAL